ncbi:MAG: hypothetical protein KJ749_09140 [Planctomycetes bacterium]|nr:hypothetical protein [Planctomycetota bacterium]
MSTRSMLPFALGVVFVGFVVALPAGAAEIAWLPISATGTHTVDGTTITLEGGDQQVTLEIRLSGWAPSLLSTYQAQIESTDSYNNSLGDPLTPVGWPDSTTDGAFITTSRSDFPFFGLTAIPAVSTYVLNYLWGAALLNPANSVPDTGGSYYGGTLILDVPAGALGVYTIVFHDHADWTFMRDEDSGPISRTLSSATINVLCANNDICDDGDGCTEDICEADGTCSHELNYDDDVWCCNPTFGTLERISDFNDCTVDVCDPADGSVTHTPVGEGTSCGGPPSGACDAQDTCDAFGNCIEQHAPPETGCGSSLDDDCTDPDSCDGAGNCLANHEDPGVGCGDPSDTDCTDPDTCDGGGNCLPNHEPNGTDCDDGAFCNMGEDCTGGLCTGGTFTCNDMVACTDDSCDEENDICYNDPNDASCDDFLWCNGEEFCHPDLGCRTVAGTIPDCNDDVDCTVDSCYEPTDVCRNIPNHGFCDNGQYCDGPELCDAELDCQPGTAPDCDDEIDCTHDSCDEGGDTCVNDPDHELCPDDGLFCNGDEICVVGVGCDHSGNPCNGPCDEENDLCLCDPPIVEAVGCRYIGVSPQPPDAGTPQAIIVRPACVDGTPKYVGETEMRKIRGPGEAAVRVGILVDDPADAVFLTPAEWGETYITGLSITPSTTLEVRADCGSPGDPALSDTTTVLTWKFGDTDNNTYATFQDIFRMVLGFQGIFHTSDVSLVNSDMHGETVGDCLPNQILNFIDILWGVFAFQAYEYADVCPLEPECPPCDPDLCDDNNACTEDGCNPETALCYNIPLYNVGTECCDPGTGTTEVIDDGDLCTTDSCNSLTGKATHTPMNCADSDDCTFDECVGGVCYHTDIDSMPCDDNSDCPPESPGCGGTYCTCPGTPAARMIWQPIESSGPYEIDDREILIPQGGVRVTLEMRVADWDPNRDGNPLLGLYQGTIDQGSFTSGSSGVLSLASDIPCETDDDCPGTLINFFAYDDGICQAPDVCDLYSAVYIDHLHPLFVFDGEDVIGATSPYAVDFSAACFCDYQHGVVDTGYEDYAGTFVLNVSPDATGTFRIDFDPRLSKTFLNDRFAVMIPRPYTLVPAYITITGN